MIKVIPLVSSILKGFMRNWKSVLLLIIFPLILIGVVFFSFNPNGIQKIPVGVVGASDNINLELYKDNYFPYLSISNYNELLPCLTDLRSNNKYACLELVNGNPSSLNIYYDNTQAQVVWELLERIKNSVDLLQKQKSKELATDFLDKFDDAMKRVENFKRNINMTNSELDRYLQETNTSIIRLSETKGELAVTLSSIDNEIIVIKSTKSSLKDEKDAFYHTTLLKINTIEKNIDEALSTDNLTTTDTSFLSSLHSNLTELKDQLVSYNKGADAYLKSIDSRLPYYENSAMQGKEYIGDINNGLQQLTLIKEDLALYKIKLYDAQAQILSMQNGFKSLDEVNADTLIEPIIIRNNPMYLLSEAKKIASDGKDDLAAKLIKGANLMSLQILFPTLLFLITLFLSILVSSFICLIQINSSSAQRLNLVNGMFIPEFLSVYLSSLIIMLLPITCVLFVGGWLFTLPILQHIFIISFVILLLSSIFILIGMALSYLIKKESITLLMSAFILVFLIFFSGFILPIERMSGTASFLATHFPTKIGLNVFNKVLFYDQGFATVFPGLLSLAIWFTVLFVIAILIKKVRA